MIRRVFGSTKVIGCQSVFTNGLDDNKKQTKTDKLSKTHKNTHGMDDIDISGLVYTPANRL